MILGCLRVDIDKKELKLDLPWHMDDESFPLGANLNQAIRVLSNAPKNMSLLKEQIDKRKEELKNAGRDCLREQVKLIDYYRKAVFPRLLRVGAEKVAKFDSNLGLICKGLREHYLQKVVRHGNYTGVEDPKLKADIGVIDIEKISDIFPFEQEEAQDKLRMLK